MGMAKCRLCILSNVNEFIGDSSGLVPRLWRQSEGLSGGGYQGRLVRVHAQWASYEKFADTVIQEILNMMIILTLF